jgi:hypothetical protein
MLNKIIKDAMLFPIFREPFDVDAAEGTDDYAVLGKNPGLAFDFIQNDYYVQPEDKKLFSDAITHARSGNATMTDGYGPELVTNGGFDGSIDGWTAEANSDVSYDDGKIRLTVESSLNRGVYQAITTKAGKTYILDASLVEITHGNATVRVGTGAGTGDLLSNTVSAGSIQLSFTATGTVSYITLRPNSVVNGNYAVFDNVSVREMPVLKWAPHNLLTYSEQFDNAAWPKTDTTINPNVAIAPDGTQTADELTHTSTAPSFSRAVSPVEDGVNYTHVVFVKYIDHQWIRIGHDSASSPFGTWFDVQNGVIGTKGSNHVSSSIEDVGNGWYKLTVEGTANGTSFSTYILLANSDGGAGKVAGTSAYIWGAHLYRSDLGGMVDNPDQPLSRASYVPTTSSAKYLPRIGHHVYNGSAWANEGLLAESEARTNLIEHSNELDGTSWTDAGLTSLTADAVGPDGVSNSAYTLTTDTSTGSHHINNNTSVTAGNTYTGSIYVKKGTQRYVRIGAGSAGVWGARVIFDLDNGAVDTVDNGSGIIKEVGNNWYRCSVTGDASSTTSTGFLIQILDASKNVTYTGAGTETVIVYGAQVEEGSTPSSLIPTSGSSVTRAAETFTIPSANLPWPEPQYIGSELVTNGTFDGASTANWTAVNATLDATDNELTITDTAGGGYVYQEITTEIGKLYNVSYTTIDARHAYVTIRSGSAIGTVVGSLSGWNGTGPTGNYSYTFVATATTHYIQINDGSSSQIQVTVDNVSVREINPLSVSIAMDGRMTYADDGTNLQASMVNWGGATGYIRHQLRTDGTNTGQIRVWQNDSAGTSDTAESDGDAYEEGILRSFNMAGRHGSTFINGALNGVAFTENTTPTELYDLSATDLNLVYDYMGTVGTFRVWDRDITDDGLVEATNPSLEPSLSLTFEGTGTNSFVVNDWSE